MAYYLFVNDADLIDVQIVDSISPCHHDLPPSALLPPCVLLCLSASSLDIAVSLSQYSRCLRLRESCYVQCYQCYVSDDLIFGYASCESAQSEEPQTSLSEAGLA